MADVELPRYFVIEDSRSGYCESFCASVVDRTRPTIYNGTHFHLNGVPQYEAVCECERVMDAEMVCRALNGAPVRTERERQLEEAMREVEQFINQIVAGTMPGFQTTNWWYASAGAVHLQNVIGSLRTERVS